MLLLIDFFLYGICVGLAICEKNTLAMGGWFVACLYAATELYKRTIEGAEK